MASRALARMTSVLVVDDDPAVRKVMTACLSDRGFSVVTASNVESAYRAVAKQNPDVILLDVKLGAQDGLQLVALLRTIELQIPCVVFTGHAGPYDGFKARDLGVANLIEKPSSPDEIAKALRQAVKAAEGNTAGATATHLPEFFTPPDRSVPVTTETLSHRVREAVRYIESHFADVTLSVTDVASHIGVTPEHLARLFKESVGKSPLVVMNELRICRVEQLLQDPRLNRTEIADLCGYRSTRQLNAWLKALRGHPPRRPSSRPHGLFETSEN